MRRHRRVGWPPDRLDRAVNHRFDPARTATQLSRLQPTRRTTSRRLAIGGINRRHEAGSLERDGSRERRERVDQSGVRAILSRTRELRVQPASIRASGRATGVDDRRPPAGRGAAYRERLQRCEAQVAGVVASSIPGSVGDDARQQPQAARHPGPHSALDMDRDAGRDAIFEQRQAQRASRRHRRRRLAGGVPRLW